jgi:hypothetical protein
LVKIAIFYHLYQEGKWGEILAEQVTLMRNSRLLDSAEFVSVGINGKQLLGGNEKFKFYINDNQEREETPTLVRLKEFARDNEDYKILYIHSKGATKDSKCIDDWRSLMNYFVIEKWQECVELLDNNDAVGCNYSEDTFLGYHPHFSGNFWWANAKYINKLNPEYLESESRWDREFWIGTGNGKMYSLHNSEINHYHYNYPRERYERND